MSLRHGSGIVQENLVLHLDAANPKSYPGTGSVWYDLAKNFNCSLRGAYQHTNDYKGALVFNGTDTGTTSQSFAPYNIDDNTTPRTWEAWVSNTTSGTNTVIFGHKASAGCSYMCNGGLVLYNGKYAFNWYDGTYRWLTSSTPGSTEPIHIVATYDPTNILQLYINGNKEAEYTASTYMDYNIGMSIFTVGVAATASYVYHYAGNIHNIKCYIGTALNATQVKQNYHALLGRFE